MKEQPMYVFSKPMRCEDDLIGWEDHFARRGILTTVRKREDGYYDLVVFGTECLTAKGTPEPVSGPCKECGSTGHFNSTDRFKFCSEECMKLHRDTKARKFTGVSWDRLVKLGIAPKE